MTPEEEFRETVRQMIVEWYSDCPRSVQFVSKVIREYKKSFPDDDFMKDIGNEKND